MALAPRTLLPSCLAFSLVFAVCSASVIFAAPPAVSQVTGDEAKNAQDPVVKSIQDLVLEYYPKVKFTSSGAKVHFECKVRNQQNQYSNRQELAPTTGGVLGDLEIKPGIYRGADKLPKEQNQYFYVSLLMAPYSGKADNHLYSRLCYPPDTPTDFLERYKETINSYANKNETAATPPPVANPSTAPAANTVTPRVAAAPTAFAPQAVSTSPENTTPTQANKAPLFLWKATRGKEVIYLLGTIHLATANFYPLAAEIDDAFDQSKQLVVEVAIDQHAPDRASIQKLVKLSGSYTAPDKLSKHMSASTKKVFDDYLHWAGETWDMYEQYKPWFVNELIQASAPRRGEILKVKGGLGLDRYFLGRARLCHKTVGELETIDFQTGLHARLSDDVQEKLLQTSLLEYKDSLKNLNELFDAWHAGDADKMDGIVNRVVREHPELAPYNKALLDQRNVGMVNKLDQMSASSTGPIFVAVGAAHLLGETGLVRGLTRKGFELTQISRGPVSRSMVTDVRVFGPERFKVWLPAEPKRKSKGDSPRVTQFEVEDGDKGIFGIICLELPTDQSSWPNPGPLLLDVMLGMLTDSFAMNSIARHTTSLQDFACRQVDCVIKSVTPPPSNTGKAGAAPSKAAAKPVAAARDETFLSEKPSAWYNGKTLRSQAYLVGNRVYILTVCGTRAWADGPEATKFMNSLQLIR